MSRPGSKSDQNILNANTQTIIFVNFIIIVLYFHYIDYIAVQTEFALSKQNDYDNMNQFSPRRDIRLREIPGIGISEKLYRYYRYTNFFANLIIIEKKVPNAK